MNGLERDRPAHLIYTDKLGHQLELDVDSGQELSAVLRLHQIPRSAIISRRDGRDIIIEDEVILPGETITLEMNRGYDLLRVIHAPTTVHEVESPVYSKSFLWFQGDQLSKRTQQYDQTTFAQYFESTFLQSQLEDGIISKGDKVALGLSGGRDSVCFLVAWERVKEQLPDHRLVAITLRGLPDWDDRIALGYCERLAKRFGVEHHVVDPQEIQERFHLKHSFLETMDRLLKTADSDYVIAIGHHAIRVMLHRAGLVAGANKIALALNLEDVLGNVLGAYSSGYMVGSVPVRRVGDIDYIYPLWLFPKKEVNLYLFLTANEFTKQGPPSRFDIGPAVRHHMYALADTIQEVWPGGEHHLLEAYRRLQRLWDSQMKFVTCSSCEAPIVDIGQVTAMCDFCNLFDKYGLLKSG